MHLSTSPDSPDAADWISSEWRQHKRHVFILSFAGKPIYSRYCIIFMFLSIFVDMLWNRFVPKICDIE